MKEIERLIEEKVGWKKDSLAAIDLAKALDQYVIKAKIEETKLLKSRFYNNILSFDDRIAELNKLLKDSRGK